VTAGEQSRINSLKARLAQLVAENEALRTRVDSMEAAMVADIDLWQLAHLNPQERVVLGLLMRRDLAHRDGIYQVLFGGRTDEVDPKVIDVLVCRIRSKIRPLGAMIETVRGIGYRLRAGDAAKLRKEIVTA
jgi:DNA-binding response OmpR family regulator